MAAKGKMSGMSALITGGGGGIGSASAELFLKDGAAVTLMGRRAEALQATRSRLLQAVPDGQVELVAGDATNEGDLGIAVEKAASFTGRIDVLLPTVGGVCAFGSILAIDMAAFRAEFELNLFSGVLALRHAAPYMTGGGAAVFISSAAGLNSFRHLSGYASAKAALEHFVRTAADELSAKGIRVNGVRAGMTRTEMTAEMFEDSRMMSTFKGLVPLERLGEPTDIATAIRYLAGPESGWITGEFISVDGGQHLRHNPDFSALASE